MSETGYKLLFEDGERAMLVVDPATARVVDANGAAARLYRYEPGGLEGVHLRQLDPGSDELLPEPGDRRVSTHVRADDTSFEAMVEAHPVRADGGSFSLLCVRDVTRDEERRRAALRQALFFRNMSDAVVITDLDGRVTDWNPAAETVFGYARDEVIGRSAAFLNPGALGEKLVREILERIEAGATWEGEVDIQRKDGSEGRAAVTVVPLRDASGEVVASVGINRDLTAQRTAEAEASQGQERFRLLAEQIPHIVWMAASDGAVEYYNRGWEAYSGRSRESGRGWGWSPVVHPDDRDRTVEAWKRAVATGDEYAVEHRLMSADGSYRWHLSRGTPMRDDEGRIVRWFGSETDIHDQKSAEVAIRARENFYRAIFEHAHDGIVLYDHDTGTVADLNAQAAALFGVSPEDVQGTALGRVAPHLEELCRQLERTRAEASVNTETTIARPDGESLVVEMNATQVELPERVVGLGIIRDVTSQRWLQRQLHQAQRMESVGRLAGGVAHDFNNFLTAIQGFSALALDRSDELSDEVRDAVVEIMVASRRAGALTRQLLAYSRQQVLDPEVLDVNELVRSMRRLLQRLIGADVELSVSLSDDLDPVHADAGQVQQVIMNLAVNARDAMPEGGSLRIDTRNEAVDEERANAHPAFKPGRYVVIEVTDTGHGMEEAVLALVFEPFFTTKAPDEGTGLGLSTAYGIVKQSGGFIWASSEPGVGSTFSVYLPATEREPGKAARHARPGRRSARRPSGETRTILVVEDESAVRRIARKCLEREAFRVIEAASGLEALSVLEDTPAIDLLLTDMIMPSMGGKQLAEHVRRIRPDLPIVFMSGYSRDLLVERGDVEGQHPVVEKPFTPAQLVTVVQEMLEGV